MRLMRRAASLAIVLGLSCAFPALAETVTVIDGDTLVYEGRQVELWGIIAPQKSETCATMAGKAWPCGQRAFDELSKAASEPDFACEAKEPGFVVCRAGGFDIGLLLVKEGLARARQDYAGVESRAREAGVGIWE